MADKQIIGELEGKVREPENSSLLYLAQIADNYSDKELFRLSFENANIGMCLVDLNGNLFKVNSEMSGIFGYSVQELQQMNVNDIAHPDFNSVSPEFIKNASDGLVAQSVFEKKYIHKNGNVVTCNVTTSSVFDENSNIICFISHVQDITAKKDAERKLSEQNAELRRLNAEKDKFFSIIAHDLKSPFNSIIGFSELLLQSVEDKNYDEVAEFADIIMKSSTRAMDLLINLMEWSQSQTGRMIFNPEFFEIGDVIEQTELLFSEIAKLKSITITHQTDQNRSVFADKSMVSTILRNFLSNAIKFTHPGGHINVSVSNIPNAFTVSVSDDGIGIPEQRIKQLFQLSESYSTPGTQMEAGSGLGLILCKEFVDKHRGEIWVESEFGKGSCFSFLIPLLNNTESIKS